MILRSRLLIGACTVLASLVVAAPALATSTLTVQAPARTEPDKAIDVTFSGFADAPGTAAVDGTGANMTLRTWTERNASNCEATAAAQSTRPDAKFAGTGFIESPAPYTLTSTVLFAANGAYRICAYLEVGQTADAAANTGPPAAFSETVVQVGDPPPPCTVPALSGITVAAATKRLKSAGCALGTVKKPRKTGRKTLVVKSQSKSSGTRLEAGAKINVVLKIKPAKKKKKR